MNTKLLVAGALLGAIISSNSDAMSLWSGMLKFQPLPEEEEVQTDPVEQAVEYVKERIRNAQIRMVAWELELVTLVQSDDALRANLARRDQRGNPAWNSNAIPDTVTHIVNMIQSCDSEVFCYRDVLQMITEDNGRAYLEKLGKVKKVRLPDGTETEKTYDMYDVINKMHRKVISRCRLWRDNAYVSVINKLDDKPIGGPNMVRELNEGDEQYRKLYEISPLKPTN